MSPQKQPRLFCYLALLITSRCIQAALTSGPMLGPIEMREAKIWIQAEENSIARIAYAKNGEESNLNWSLPCETDPTNGNTATLVLSEVEPGKLTNIESNSMES